MVVDTHVFLWYIVGDSRLPSAIMQRMAADPESVIVPSICFWEAMMLHDRGRLDLGPNPAKTLLDALKDSGFRTKDLDPEIAMLSRTLAFDHEDPADRFIAATGDSLNLPLATADKHLQGLSWLKLAWS